jgi:amino acid permease
LHLDGLAAAGNAPRIFLKTLKNGLPLPAIIFGALFALLAYMDVSNSAGKVFGWFGEFIYFILFFCVSLSSSLFEVNMTSVAGKRGIYYHPVHTLNPH